MNGRTKMNIAIVGATGIVGQTFINLLENKQFPFKEFKLFASPKNEGKKIPIKGQERVLQSLQPGCFQNVDIAFFSAGEAISRKWANEAVKCGAFVIDNSSAFRMEKEVPLVVPEINAHLIKSKKPGIIANPNCSTIQLTLALNPLQHHFGLDTVVVSSYQSLSGAGLEALNKLKTESISVLNKKTHLLPDPSNQYAFNCIPNIGPIDENGFSKEENKLMNETRKILNLPELQISATAVRVPCFNGHGESVWITLKKPVDNLEAVIKVLEKQAGITVLKKETLPNQVFTDGKDDVYIGRIRPIPNSQNKDWIMWICADNLRKGAALNGLQIAEKLIT